MIRSIVVCVAVVLAVTASLTAHHSPVMFDRSVQKTLVGSVVEFAWTNPHSSIQLDVPNSAGGVDRWGVELGSPNSMVKAGWRSTTIKPGRVNVWGTVVGVAILAVGISGIQQMGAVFYVEPLFNGVTLLLAIGIAGYAQRKRGNVRRVVAARPAEGGAAAPGGGGPPV